MTTTVRVSEETRRRVAALAKSTGRRMQAILDEAVAAYEKSLFWESFTAGYDALRQDREAWADVERERALEQPTLRDGLE